mgnify:FL=1
MCYRYLTLSISLFEILKEYLLILHLFKCFNTHFAKLSRILGEPLYIFGTHVRLALDERRSLG